jgi:pimeloyl-ACP methyl ester carboxylesterase
VGPASLSVLASAPVSAPRPASRRPAIRWDEPECRTVRAMPSTDPLIETGALPTGHPYARIGSGSRLVLSIPGLSFTAEPAKPGSVRRAWKRWLVPIERYDLTVVDIGRRADIPPGSSSVDIADDYADVIREQWGRAVGVMGISTGGGYAQWLASRHPELVDRLVLAYTGHRVPPEVAAVEREAVDHFLAGRWRSGFALMAPWVVPQHARIASAAAWLLGPYIAGRPSDLRVLRLDADADDTHDATDALGGIQCPTLVISGGRDLAYPPELTRELVAGIPDVRHIEYADAGHGGGVRFPEDACAFLGPEERAPRG